MDTTGSTPALTDKNGTPLALLPEFAEDPDAMFILWKDHTAVAEADEINALCKNWGGKDYTRYSGGTYSSEWFWSKLLHTIRKNKKVKKAAFCAVEHCDWMTALLCGKAAPDKIKRSRCAAGHKCMWHKSWGGYPSKEFLSQLEPKLAQIASLLGSKTWTTEEQQGKLTKEWADKLGLQEDIPVCIGAYDAHIGAVGGGVAEGVMVKSIGTSTCDIIIGHSERTKEKCIPGICGQVDGSVISGKIGYEAGQSSYGDYYRWFRDLLLWPLKNGAGKALPGCAPRSRAGAGASSTSSVLHVVQGGAVCLDGDRQGKSDGEEQHAAEVHARLGGGEHGRSTGRVRPGGAAGRHNGLRRGVLGGPDPGGPPDPRGRPRRHRRPHPAVLPPPAGPVPGGAGGHHPGQPHPPSQRRPHPAGHRAGGGGGG